MNEELDHIHLDQTSVCIPGPEGSCSICGDEALEGEVLGLLPGNLAVVSVPNGRQEIAVDLVEDVQVGDKLLVHLGFAIAKLQ